MQVRKLRVALFALALVAAVGISVGFGQGVHALSEQGPDPGDFVPQNAGDRFSFGVSSAIHEYASIPQTRVNLYFANNQGNKSIVITGGDLCTDGTDSALNGSGGNYWDRPFRFFGPNTNL